MRKRGVLMLSMLAGFALASGGVLEAGGFKLLGGPGWGRYAADWDMHNHFKPGYLLGAAFEGPPAPLSYEVDLLYFKKTNSYLSRGWDYELGEISVPFLAKLRPFPGSTPFLLAGGEVAYILSHKQTPGSAGGDSVLDMMDNTKSFDYGLVFGLGFGVDVGGLTLEMSGRYHHGLAKVTGLSWQEYDLRTRELAVVLGVLF